MALVAVLFGSGFYRYEEWSIGDFIGFESYYTRATFTVWKPKQWRNGTATIWEEFSEDASIMSVTLGVVGATANFFGWLQEHAVLDIVLLLIVAMNQRMSRLIRIIHDDDATIDTKWEEYESMRKSSNKVNTTIQYLLPLAHISNLLLVSYFLLGGYKRFGYMYVCMLGAKMTKILATYWIAAATAHKVTRSYILYPK